MPSIAIAPSTGFKPQRHLGGHRRGPVQHGMDGLTRHAHAAGSFGNRQLDVLFEDLTHQHAGMNRWPLQKTTYRILPAL
jgi:hypothetical protein